MKKIAPNYIYACLGAAHYYDLANLYSQPTNKDYKEAEQMSDFINCIFDQETKPDDFIHDDDSDSNEAIKNFESYQNIINASGEYKRNVETFCKWYANKKPKILTKNIGVITVLLMLYLSKKEGKITKEQAEKKFKELKSLKSPLWQFNGMEIRFAYRLICEISLDINLKIQKGII